MKKIVGIWDLLRSGGTLGTLLILLEELQIQRRIHGADAFDLIVVGDAAQLCKSEGSEGVDCFDGDTESRIDRAAGMIPVLRAMAGVGEVHVCRDRPSARKAAALIASDRVVWPRLEALTEGGHRYDSTRFIRDFFARAGEIPTLSVKPELAAWSQGYLAKKGGGRLPVAVHLKNNPAIAGQSNANAVEWLAFIEACQREHPAHFVLVGDDPVAAPFGTLSNVSIANDDGIALERSLALIQAAGLFMGMMSGPANMALFGKKPYLIFKNPDHHALEMTEEIGTGDRYCFAAERQRVLRIWDTAENLAEAFRFALGQIA